MLTVTTTRYDSDNFPNLVRRLGQIGIDVRQAGQHARMREYLQMLEAERCYTLQFLREEQDVPANDWCQDVPMR